MVRLHIESQTIRSILFLWFVIFAIVIVLLLASTAGRGFEDPANKDKFMFYLGIFIICGIIITIDQATRHPVTRERKYVWWLGSYLFNVNDSIIPSKWLHERFLGVGKRLFMFSTIIFYLTSMISVHLNTFFVGFVTHYSLKGQIFPLASYLFSASPAAGAETLLLAVLLGSVSSIIRRVTKKRYSASYVGLMLLASLLIGFLLFGFGWHTLVAKTEFDLLGAGALGTASCLLMVITGSIIPAWIFHWLNNLFFDLNRFYSDQYILLITGGVFVVLVIIFIFNWRIKKKRAEES